MKRLFSIVIVSCLLSSVSMLSADVLPRSDSLVAFLFAQADPFAKEVEESVEMVELSEEELEEVKEEFERALKKKLYPKAYEILQQIPEETLKPRERRIKVHLEMFNTVLADELESQESGFKADDSIPKKLKKRIKSLYKEAQYAYIEDKHNVTKDLLIHIIYLDRMNVKAKKLLEYAYDMAVGSYKVENMENKYWNRNSISFYGGNYLAAIDDLTILTYLDKENSEVFDRLGSAYYMSGQKSKAIGSWNTSLFLMPENEKLKALISETQALLDKEKAVAKARAAKRKKEMEEMADTEDVEMQMMGAFNKRDKAFDFAQKLKAKGFAPVVEELDNGKYGVMIPKKKKAE